MNFVGLTLNKNGKFMSGGELPNENKILKHIKSVMFTQRDSKPITNYVAFYYDDNTVDESWTNSNGERVKVTSFVSGKGNNESQHNKLNKTLFKNLEEINKN